MYIIPFVYTFKPRTNFYIFILGGGEFQTDDPKECKTRLVWVNVSARKDTDI